MVLKLITISNSFIINKKSLIADYKTANNNNNNNWGRCPLLIYNQ